MFRAILWKEWRELWMLVFVVLVFTAFGVLLDQWWGEDMGLFVWFIPYFSLVIISVLIPHQLFSTEWEKRTSFFILSKPMDRFRLWWLKVIAGALFLGAMGIVAGALAVGAKALFPREATVDPRYYELIRLLYEFGLFLFGFSTFAFAAFKTRGRILMVVFSCAWIGFVVQEELPALLISIGRSAWIASPLLMFLSLVAFAQGDFRRRTARAVILGYTVSALLFLGFLALGRALLNGMAL